MKKLLFCLLSALSLTGCVAEYPDDRGAYYSDSYDNGYGHRYWHRDDADVADRDEEHHFWRRGQDDEDEYRYRNHY